MQAHETFRTGGTAEEAPGTSALKVGSAGAAIVSVSCAAVGADSAGGEAQAEKARLEEEWLAVAGDAE